MAASLSVVPLFIKSKLKVVICGENSLLSWLQEISRSFVNMIRTIPSKILLKANKTSLFLTRYWYYGWSFIKARPKLKEKTKHESEVVHQALHDSAAQVNASTITSLYSHILDNNFFGITSESLELLRYESKVLQGLQDFELLTTLKSLFGCVPKDYRIARTETAYGVSEYFWNASILTWRAILNRLVNIPVISWILAFRKVSDQVKCTTIIAPASSILECKESSETSIHTTLPSAGSILMCETSILPTIISDSGCYALSTTHDLLKEAILLFVPMEMLENATELLKGPHSLSLSTSPVSSFWQLFNYVSIWGLDIIEEVCNQPEINYVNVDDDDFHFVVNVPKLRRPILFIGIR